MAHQFHARLRQLLLERDEHKATYKKIFDDPHAKGWERNEAHSRYIAAQLDFRAAVKEAQTAVLRKCEQITAFLTDCKPSEAPSRESVASLREDIRYVLELGGK